MSNSSQLFSTPTLGKENASALFEAYKQGKYKIQFPYKAEQEVIDWFFRFRYQAVRVDAKIKEANIGWFEKSTEKNLILLLENELDISKDEVIKHFNVNFNEVEA